MARGQQGNLFVNIPGSTYQVGLDSLFLLDGMRDPVLLRRHSDTDSYALISVCTLSVAPPGSGVWLNPQCWTEILDKQIRLSDL
jgi:hypothetical protein